MPIFDSAWAAIGNSPFRRSPTPISTFDFTATFGLVGRDVEGLEPILFYPKPPLAYGIYYHLLDMGNSWFCLLKFSTDEYGFMIQGKAYIYATIFHLVKKRTDKVTFRETHCFLGEIRLPSPRSGAQRLDGRTVVKEIQVFGAEEVRNSLFVPGVENYNTHYVAVGSFVMKKQSTP